jgi:iron complex outermembrane receptor protein
MGMRWRACCALIVTAALGVEARGDDRPPDFAGLSMEQLLEVDLVYAASRHAQTLRDAPSSVTVVSADEIRRQGYRTLAELLRALPSFYVTYDRNYSYVGVRGFGRPGDYNTRILFLLNGVRLNDNIYGAQLPGTEFVVDMETVERVEVVRGPAASLYGGNALFAVVNVVTRRGSDVKGGELSASAGSFGTLQGRAAYGGALPANGDYVVSVSAMGSSGQDLFFPEFASGDHAGWARGLDGDAARRGFASASWRGLSFQAAHSWRRKDVPTAAYGVVFGDGWNRTWDESTAIALQYQRTLGATDVFARGNHGRYRYRGHYAFEPRYVDFAAGDWWAAEAGASRTLGRHLLAAGLEAQWDAQLRQGAGHLGAPADLDLREDGARWGFYARDEIRLTEGWRAHVGLRHDTFGHEGGHTSPRLGLVYAGGRQTLKLLFGSAFRAPNEYELHYYDLAHDLRPETIRTLEAVYERQLGANGRLVAAVFDNRINGLITLRGDAGPDELYFTNAASIRSRGLELTGEWRRRDGLRGSLSYSLQKSADRATGEDLTNSPRHMAKAQAELPLAGGRVWAAVNTQYIGPRWTLAGARLDGHALAGLTVSAPRVVSRLGVSLGVGNLFDTRFADPGSEEHVQDALMQDGRSLRLGVDWKF